MNANEIEDLFLRSLDQPITDAEKEQLVKGLQSQVGLSKDMSQYKTMREAMLRKDKATFGPYFAQKVMTKIQNLRVEIDKQIMFFFRKYQLAALGVFIALLSVNVIFADQVDLPSVLGVEDSAVTTTPADTDDELLSFDLYENLTNNNN